MPNLTLGAPIVRSLRKHTDAYLDCHLMVTDPGQWVDDFAAAGASGFTFHLEAVDEPEALVERIHDAGMKAGVALKPKTPLETPGFLELVPKLDMVLVMTVEPGFGGQKFMADQMPKVAALRSKFPALHIQVDGGVNVDTIAQCAEAGANVIVSGSGVFKAPSPEEAIAQMRAVVDAHVAKSS